MNNTALLVVDVQTALVEEQPFNIEEVLANIGSILSFSHTHDIEVIYVRHDGGTGDELEYNSRGWELYGSIAPAANERVFDKRYSSAFRDTGLKNYLDSKEIKNIVLVGMQTEYCIDTTCKVAFEYGYKVFIPEGTTTTFDNKVLSGKELNDYYSKTIWNGRFAEVIPIRALFQKLTDS